MPTLDPVGRVDDPDDFDLEPVIIPVVGYTREKEEVIHEARFRPFEPTGEAMEMMRSTDAEGNVGGPALVAYLDACVESDDFDSWKAFLSSPDVYIEATVLRDVYQALTAYYAGRPTVQRSVSHNGRVTSKKTSRAAARSTASTTTRRAPSGKS